MQKVNELNVMLCEKWSNNEKYNLFMYLNDEETTCLNRMSEEEKMKNISSLLKVAIESYWNQYRGILSEQLDTFYILDSYTVH